MNFGPKCPPKVENVPPTALAVMAAFRDSVVLASYYRTVADHDDIALFNVNIFEISFALTSI